MREALHNAGFSGDALDDLCRRTEEAQNAFPGLSVGRAPWVARLAKALNPSGVAAVSPGEIRVSDLYLSCGLEAQDPNALEVFERELVPQIDRALRSLARSADERDELRQLVRVRVLVSTGQQPARISKYSGRGSLAGWIRTIAARVASNHRRSQRPHADLDQIPELGISETPEFACLRDDHRLVFLKCLRGAFGALEPRQRAIVRLHYGNQMTAVALSRSYAVHESTMSRWLATARVAMAEHFEQLAVEAVGEHASATNLLAVIRSRLDLSLQSLFATTASRT